MDLTSERLSELDASFERIGLWWNDLAEVRRNDMTGAMPARERGLGLTHDVATHQYACNNQCSARVTLVSLHRVMGLAGGTLLLVVASACGSADPASPGASTPGATSSPTTGSEPSVAPSEAVAECGTYPDRDIELIIPSNPGGGFDTWGRMLAPLIEKHLDAGVNVLPVNVAGAGSLIATTEVANDLPGGYKLLLNDPAAVVTPMIGGSTDLDISTFAPVARVTVAPEVLVVGADSEWDSVEDMQAAAQERPLLFAHGAISASQVVTMDTLGVDWSSVIIEGSSDAILSIIRGDTEFALYPVTTVAESIAGGEIKPLLTIGTTPEGDATGADFLADVPTLDEVSGEDGLGAALEQHRILFTAPGTEPCIVEMLEAASLAAMADPEIEGPLETAGFSVFPLGSEEAGAVVTNLAEALARFEDVFAEHLTE
jgi:tripartite-type tricarboxylate transporter receptor subunit TctC